MTLNHIFTKSNKNMKFIYDNEGLWSITHMRDAEFVTNKILELTQDNKLHIVDMTAGCGGNTISFMHQFTNITTIELNKTRYNMLKNNINQYQLECNINIINDDCIKYIDNDYDIYFFDPPWGGPQYKKKDIIELYLSDIELKNIIEMIPNKKLIVLKLPFNYDYNFINEKYTLLYEELRSNVRFVFFNN